MCGRKGDAENLNEKKNINIEKDIGIRKCRRKDTIYKYNEEVRGCTYSSKNPKRAPDNNKNERGESSRKVKKKENTSRP